MLLQRQKPTVAVVITNHNYNDFLPEALLSISKQTLLPDVVVVVDDASKQSCESFIKSMDAFYIRVEHKHPIMARRAGFLATKTDYVCFLDADDKLPPHYLAKAIAVLSDENIDIAFSDLHKFGDENKLVHFPEDIKPERLWQTNFLHVGCVVSRDAIILSQAFDGCPLRHDYHEDWMFWRNIVGAGFRYRKHDVPYLSRIHPRNRSKSVRKCSYAQSRAVADATYEWCWHKVEGQNKLIVINKIARQTTAEYIGFGHSRDNEEEQKDNKIWVQMAQHLDHDIGAVYDEDRDNLLFVGPVLRNTIIRKQEIEKWPIKVARISHT